MIIGSKLNKEKREQLQIFPIFDRATKVARHAETEFAFILM